MYAFIRVGLQESGPTSLDVLKNDVTVDTLDATHGSTVQEVNDGDTVTIIPTPAS